MTERLERLSFVNRILNFYIGRWNDQVLIYLGILCSTVFAALVADLRFGLQPEWLALCIVMFALSMMLVVPSVYAVMSDLAERAAFRPALQRRESRHSISILEPVGVAYLDATIRVANELTIHGRHPSREPLSARQICEELAASAEGHKVVLQFCSELEKTKEWIAKSKDINFETFFDTSVGVGLGLWYLTYVLEHHELVVAKQRYENHLEELVEQRTAELDRALEALEDAYRSTLNALTVALETRDSDEKSKGPKDQPALFRDVLETYSRALEELRHSR